MLHPVASWAANITAIIVGGWRRRYCRVNPQGKYQPSSAISIKGLHAQQQIELNNQQPLEQF